MRVATVNRLLLRSKKISSLPLTYSNIIKPFERAKKKKIKQIVAAINSRMKFLVALGSYIGFLDTFEKCPTANLLIIEIKLGGTQTFSETFKRRFSRIYVCVSTHVERYIIMKKDKRACREDRYRVLLCLGST